MSVINKYKLAALYWLHFRAQLLLTAVVATNSRLFNIGFQI